MGVLWGVSETESRDHLSVSRLCLQRKPLWEARGHDDKMMLVYGRWLLYHFGDIFIIYLWFGDLGLLLAVLGMKVGPLAYHAYAQPIELLKWDFYVLT